MRRSPPIASEAKVETELKLVVDEATAKDIWRRARAAGMSGRAPRARLLRSVYYDTPDGDLKAAGVALRLRRDRRRWVQTVKIRVALASGLSRAEEWEAPAPGGRVDLARIGCEDARLSVERAIAGKALSPVCETAIDRAAAIVAPPQGQWASNGRAGEGRAELSVDRGEIIANGRSVRFCEVEIELVEGEVAALYAIAATLFPTGDYRFSRMSKAGRGYRLAAGGAADPPPAPRRARKVPLTPDQTTGAAARDVIRECLAQIAESLDATRLTDDPEGPHQLRVGLRRLRTAFTVFAPAIAGPETRRLAGEARWLGREVGHVRDLDVAANDLIGREAAIGSDADGFAALSMALAAASVAARRGLGPVLAGRRASAFILDLARYVETGGWSTADDADRAARLAAPVADAARTALDKAWRHSSRRAKGLADLNVEARHELRKSLKRLRYATEYFGPLHAKGAVKPFLRKLKTLQGAFGDLNDLAMAEALFTGAAAIGAGDPAAQRAIGRILGAGAARADAAWRETGALWVSVKTETRFWRQGGQGPG